MKAGHREVVPFQVQLHQEVLQDGIVPFAGDFVQSNVQGLLFCLVLDVQNNDLGLGIAQVHHHIAALVALDDGAIAVDHDGIGVPELVQAVPDLDVFRVIRGQFLAGIVFSRV